MHVHLRAKRLRTVYTRNTRIMKHHIDICIALVSNWRRSGSLLGMVM